MKKKIVNTKSNIVKDVQIMCFNSISRIAIENYPYTPVFYYRNFYNKNKLNSIIVKNNYNIIAEVKAGFGFIGNKQRGKLIKTY